MQKGGEVMVYTNTKKPDSKGNSGWVNFKEVKQRVSLKAVLEHYGLLDLLKPSGKNLIGCCPIHQGSNPRQFSVNLKENIFNCFGDCKSGGNVLDFVAKMDEVTIREAALRLSEWFQIQPEKETDKKNPKKRENEGPVQPKDEKIINPPLKFRLKTLNPTHSFFAEYGISSETTKHFGLGYAGRGIMANRIAIPIHNEQDELIAYCGRAVSDEQAESEGKYKLPPNFVKQNVVYNLNRQKLGEPVFILVESFLSVFRFYEAGHPNTLSLMGSSLSDKQAELILY